jgi:hypothetical protein
MVDSYNYHPLDPAKIRANTPPQLHDLRVWLLWKLVRERDPKKKPKKVPFYISGNPRKGETDTPEDRAQLATLDIALRHFNPKWFAGVGLVLGKAKVPGTDLSLWLSGIDLDDCVVGGLIAPRAEAIIRAANSYTEYSPSRTGVKIVGVGAIGSYTNHDVGVEIYDGGRFFTMTGEVAQGDTLADLTAAAQAAREYAQQEKRPTGTNEPVLINKQRNNFLSKEAYRHRKLGANQQEILDIVRTINKVRCQPPLEDRELQTIAKSKARVVRTNKDDLQTLVKEINNKHAVLWIKGKLHVMWKEPAEGQLLPTLSTVDDLRTYWKNRRVGNRNPFDEWLDSPERAEYTGIVFKPGVADVGTNFNIFRGWGVIPAPGECSLFLAHLRDVICSGEDDVFDYLMQWLANIIQQPMSKPGTALSLGSGQGAGKGALARYLKPILGEHLLTVAGADLLTQRFNDFFLGRLLVFGDEAVFPPDKRGALRLSSFITEEYITIEPKFVPVFQIQNLTRFALATYKDHATPAEIDDRRWIVPRVSNARTGDMNYWKALTHEQHHGGPAALLDYLLKLPITRELRATPRTRALSSQKLLGLDAIGGFWREMLMTKEHTLAEGYGEDKEYVYWSFDCVVMTTTLHKFFLDYVKRNRLSYPASLDALGRTLRKYLPDLTRREARSGELPAECGRTQVYVLPSLKEARQRFEDALGAPVEWPEPVEVSEDFSWPDAGS